MLDGGPITVWSESGLEAWNKHIRNFRSEAGCRVRQALVKSNLEDILVCMLIIFMFNDIFNKIVSPLYHTSKQHTIAWQFIQCTQWTKNFGFDDETVCS